jgi:hypothetical protein
MSLGVAHITGVWQCLVGNFRQPVHLGLELGQNQMLDFRLHLGLGTEDKSFVR